MPTITRGRLVLAAGLLCAFVLATGPVSDPDLPWHLAAGRHIVETRSIPRVDFLSWTMEGKPWIDFEWGSELLLYGLHRLGGAAALDAFRVSIDFGVALLFAAVLGLWGMSELAIGLALPLFAVALFPVIELRPELFSELLFATELLLLEARRLGRLKLSNRSFVLLHAAIYALWANLHGGFAAGLLLCGCYALGEWIHDGPARTLAVATALGVVATLINPYGWRIYTVFVDHWVHFQELRTLIIEWAPPSFERGYLGGYWLVLAFSFSGLVLASFLGTGLPSEHVITALAFGFFSSRAVRTAPYAALSLYPLGLAAWRAARLPPALERARAPAVAIGLALVAWRAWDVARNQGVFTRPAPIAQQGPDKACAFLEREKPALGGLRLFNPYNWGGYLGYTLAPDYKPFMDGRYLFADLLTRVDDAQPDPVRWRGLLDEQKVDIAMVYNDGFMLRPRDGYSGRPFTGLAMQRSEWALVYWDSQAIIVVRRARVPQDWLKRHEYRYLHPHDLRHLGLMVVVGAAPLRAVSAEIDRYAREIGDPYETENLERWRAEFEKGLASSPRRAARRKMI